MRARPHLRLRRAGSAAFAAVVALGVIGPVQQAQASFCTLPGLTPNTWEGGASGDWNVDANWSLGFAPNQSHGGTGYVCIPGGATVTMHAGDRADVQAFDVAAGARLRLETGSKLFVYGNQGTRPSVLRTNARLDLMGSLGGNGRIEAHGLVNWTSTNLGAATIATRNCALTATCPGPAAQPGRLVVGNTGELRINGQGVNLEDQYRVTVQGLVHLTGTGYISADRGTYFELVPKTGFAGVGSMVVSNNGGYYEGRTLNDITTLSRFVNAGSIVKNGTGGTAVIAANYSRAGAGSVRVMQGAATFPGGVTQVAQVDPGKTYGIGQCVSYDSYGCVPATEPSGDVQNGTFQVPAADASGAGVQLFTLNTAPPWAIGTEYRLHATGLSATRAAPATVNFRYDSSILNGKRWWQVNVLRRADGSATYTPLPPCTAAGHVPASSVACVDRRGLAGSSRNVHDPGDLPSDPWDVIMVVKTTQTSRWVGR